MARLFHFFRRCGGLLAALGALAAAPVPAAAHVLNMTRVELTLVPPHDLELKVAADLSLILGDYKIYRDLMLLPPAEQATRLNELGRRLIDILELKLDGQKLNLTPQTWTLPDTPPDKIGDQSVAAMTGFRYLHPLPPAARELTLSPGSMARIEFPVAYTFSIPWEDLLMTRWLELPGAVSRVLTIPSLSEFPAPAPAPIGAAAENAAPDKAATAPTSASIPAATAKVPAAGEFTATELQVARFVSTVLQYLKLGFLHIFPQGSDHVLFVLGLFFLGARWRPLLSQTTAFTIAHTTTLGLSAYGLVSLSPRIVEPLIALSITYVALENIFKPKLTAARIAIVFAFGLLHGLGFAGSLKEVPMPRDQFFTALLSFNLGVDGGQLAVIAMAFLAVGWFRHQPWYRQRIVVPGCALIAGVGAYWTVTRLFT